MNKFIRYDPIRTHLIHRSSYYMKHISYSTNVCIKSCFVWYEYGWTHFVLWTSLYECNFVKYEQFNKFTNSYGTNWYTPISYYRRRLYELHFVQYDQFKKSWILSRRTGTYLFDTLDVICMKPTSYSTNSTNKISKACFD